MSHTSPTKGTAGFAGPPECAYAGLFARIPNEAADCPPERHGTFGLSFPLTLVGSADEVRGERIINNPRCLLRANRNDSSAEGHGRCPSTAEEPALLACAAMAGQIGTEMTALRDPVPQSPPK